MYFKSLISGITFISFFTSFSSQASSLDRPEAFGPRKGMNTLPGLETDSVLASARKLREAMKGRLYDEKAIIDVVVASEKESRLEIAEAYKYDFKRDLLTDLREGLKDDVDFQRLVTGTFLSMPDFLAYEIRTATQGNGTDEDIFADILCCLRDNELKELWKSYVGRKPPRHFIPSDIFGNVAKEGLHDILLQLATRNFTEVNEKSLKIRAMQSMTKLNPLFPVLSGYLEQSNEKVESREGLPESVKNFGFRYDDVLLMDIFAKESWHVIKKLTEKSENQPTELTLTSVREKVIERVTKGSYRQLLLIILHSSDDVVKFYAQRIHDGFKKDSVIFLTRMLAIGSTGDVWDVDQTFSKMFNETLKQRINDCKTTSPYKSLALALLQNARQFFKNR